VIDRKFSAKRGDRSLKFLENFQRPFTSFDTQIWGSVIDRKFSAKSGDRSLKFLENFQRPFTSFLKIFEDHLQVLTHKFGDRSQI
jgi:hypothetical protein